MALKTNLVSYWNLNEQSGNRNDSHGSNHLAGLNSPTYQTDGVHGDVLQILSASSQAVWISDASQSGLDLTGNMTMNIWFNPITLTAPTSNNHGLMTKWNHSSQNQYQWNFASTTSQITGGADDACGGFTYTFVTLSLGVTVAIDTWYMVSFVRTGTTLEMFLNGVSLGTGTTQTSSDCTADFAIGMEKGRDLYKANGRFTKAGIWSRALSSGELLELHNSGNGRTYAQLDLVTFTPRTAFVI